MKRSTLALVFALALAPTFAPLAQAAFDKDLGQGVRYFRTAKLPAELESLRQASRSQAVVIDLRAATGTPEAIRELEHILNQAGSSGLRVLLVNAKTAPEIVRVVAVSRPRQLTISPASANLPTDIKVNITPDRDAEAYAAMENGTALEKLISSNPEKRRFDESTLARSHANGGGGSGPGTTNGAEEDEGDPDNTPPAPPAHAPADTKAPTPPPLHDLVLERAVQLHRALDAKLGIKP